MKTQSLVSRLVVLTITFFALVSSVCGQNLSISRVPADIVSFQGLVGANYTVQGSTNLQSGVWQDLATVTDRGDGWFSYTNFPTSPILFYRTVLTAPMVLVAIGEYGIVDQTIQISKVNPTRNLTLAVFVIKTTGASGVLRQLKVKMNITGVTNIAELFTNVRLKIGGVYYSASAIEVQTGIVTFANLTVPMIAESYWPMQIIADVPADTTGALNNAAVSISIVASGTAGGTQNNPWVEDSSYTTIAVVGSSNTSATTTFSSSGLLITSTSATHGPVNVSPVTGWTSYQVHFFYTLTTGDNPVYLSKDPAVCVITQDTLGSIFSPSAINTTDSGLGDGQDYFYIAPEQSRSFVFTGWMVNEPGAIHIVWITGIRFGTSSANVSSNTLLGGMGDLKDMGP